MTITTTIGKIPLLALFYLAVTLASAQEYRYLGNSKVTNDSIRTQLEGMYGRTMSHRNKYFESLSKYGEASDSSRHRLRKMIQEDSIMLHEVLAIYNKFGWPKKSQVGEIASTWAFIQIQHADQEIQLQFLPIIYMNALTGETVAHNFALLIDRILSRRHCEQIYGTQYIGYTYSEGNRVSILWPVVDFKSINKRRRKIGLGRIQKELRGDGVRYDASIGIADIERQQSVNE